MIIANKKFLIILVTSS